MAPFMHVAQRPICSGAQRSLNHPKFKGSKQDLNMKYRPQAVPSAEAMDTL